MTTTLLKRYLTPLVIILLTLLFFRHLAFSDMILARGDTFNYFYPYWDLRNAAFRAGELPLWSNNLFMGVPLLANPQLGSYYPLNWLTAPFPAPQAIKISILLHSVLAGLGTAYLFHQTIAKRIWPALVAAIIYTFSGYLGAHVEQINQFQGLAWLPLLFALYHRAMTARSPWRDGLLLALAWALQIFCGHTQTVFISGIGFGAYGLGLGLTAREPAKQIGRRLLLLAVPTLLALLLALPQLLPSLELISLSNRGSGFSRHESTAFSLPPSLLGRALLPNYDGQLFGEYIGYIGVVGLGLALWGIMAKGVPAGHHRVWLGIALLGLLLALGRHNPLYLLLAELPGFNLFRVPARFLALYTLSLSVLAGAGAAALDARHLKLQVREHKRSAIAVILGIAGLILLTVFVLKPDATHFFGPSEIRNSSLALWGVALLALSALLILRHRRASLIAAGLVALELVIAAQNLPYNDLSPPDVYLGQRFTISQLLAYQSEETVPGRTLSISQIYFDPGDIQALRARYDRLGMDWKAQFHALDAVKKQLMLMPNQSLTWNIPTIDGFGGGITPTMGYSQFTSLLLPKGAARAVDGRLGERMALPNCRGACIPELRWLQMTDTRYVIVDKVYDVWHEDIAYDTALENFWQGVAAIDLADDGFDRVHVLHREALDLASEARTLDGGLLLSVTDSVGLQSILTGEHSIVAVTLVHSRNQTLFKELQPPPIERVLSSEIKIYRVPPAGGRAFLAQRTRILPATWQGYEDTLGALREGDSVVINSDASLEALAIDEPGKVDVVEYSETRVRLQVESPAPAYLVLRDAYYPGWQAMVNGQATPIQRANIVFRAVQAPAGESTVVFNFEPRSWRTALLLGAGLWLAALLVLWRLLRR